MATNVSNKTVSDHVKDDSGDAEKEKREEKEKEQDESCDFRLFASVKFFLRYR